MNSLAEAKRKPTLLAEPMSMAKRIALARKEAGLSQQNVADRFGISRAAVAQWENGDTYPGTAKLEGLAEVLRVRLEWLATGRGVQRADINEFGLFTMSGHRMVPLIDPARAAYWPTRRGELPANEVPTEVAAGPASFALVIDDDSMAPALATGDKIIVDPDVAPRSGDYVVATVEDDDAALVRLYRPRPDGSEQLVELVPFDRAWTTRTIGGGKSGRIIGTMVEHRRYRRP
ncbi:MAG: LexA family transcriptional regulator [Alphaproteobacteria bacterium]